MQYEAKTPAEYIRNLDKDWRLDTLQSIRKLIRSREPKVVEAINYKMLSYSDERGLVFHLNAQKSYVSLYVGDASKIDSDGTLLEGLDRGKGCIRFKKSTKVAETRIDAFIDKAFELRAQGVDIDC